VIRRSRGHDVPEEILGDFDGYLIVDGLKSYDVLDVAKGRCNGHLLRRCKELEQTLPKAQKKWATQLKELLQAALALAQKRAELDAAVYARRVEKIEERLDAWLDSAPLKDADVERLVNHVSAHRGEWLVFLHDAAVPATNNHAERMIRPAVITRKVGGCNKTLKGAAVHGVLASLIATCRQQGRRFLDLAKRLWTGEASQAIHISELPDPGSAA
jgi:transposase